jgi:hypothetical protein
VYLVILKLFEENWLFGALPLPLTSLHAPSVVQVGHVQGDRVKQNLTVQLDRETIQGQACGSAAVA